MTSIARAQARTLLADLATTCAAIDAEAATSWPPYDEKLHEHREQLDRDLAALVPDLLAELDALAPAAPPAPTAA